MIILKWHTAYLKADLTQHDNRDTLNIKANADCDELFLMTYTFIYVSPDPLANWKSKEMCTTKFRNGK